MMLPEHRGAGQRRDLCQDQTGELVFETRRIARGFARSEALSLFYGAHAEYCVALRVSRNMSGHRPRCRMG